MGWLVRQITRGLLLFVAFVLVSAVASAGVITQWSSSGLGGLAITSIAADPFVYAATSTAGVFHSLDGGTSWTAINEGLADLSVVALAVGARGPTTICPAPCLGPLMVATAHRGVFRRAFEATSWEPANNGLPNYPVVSLTYSPFGGWFYAGTVGGGVFRTNDFGTTWTAINGGLSSLQVQTFAAAPGSSTVLVGTDGPGGAFKSFDGGSTWTPFVVTPQGFSAIAFAIDPRSSTTFYAVGIGQPCPPPCAAPSSLNLYRSIDGASSWQLIALLEGLGSVRTLAVSFQDAATIWAGGSGGAFESMDGGMTWRAINTGLGTSPYVAALLLVPGQQGAPVYAGTGNGVYRAFSGRDICVAGDTTLCLAMSRFSVSLSWRDSAGTAREARAVPLTSIAGGFWFFDPSNLEVVVKILNGFPVNGNFWVFYGGLSDQEYTITVIDTQTGRTKTYFNPRGRLASVADTAAF